MYKRCIYNIVRHYTLMTYTYLYDCEIQYYIVDVLCGIFSLHVKIYRHVQNKIKTI